MKLTFMKRIATSILFLFCALGANAGVDTLIQMTNWNITSSAAANRKVQVKPVIYSNSVVGPIDIQSYTSDTAGQFYISNQLSGYYQFDIQQPPQTRRMFLSVIDGVGQWIPPSTAWTFSEAVNLQAGYTRAQTDALIQAATNGFTGGGGSATNAPSSKTVANSGVNIITNGLIYTFYATGAVAQAVATVPVLWPNASVTNANWASITVSNTAMLGAAVSNAPLGSTIVLSPGTYDITNSYLYLRPGISLQGSGTNSTIVRNWIRSDDTQIGNRGAAIVPTLNNEVRNLQITNALFPTNYQAAIGTIGPQGLFSNLVTRGLLVFGSSDGFDIDPDSGYCGMWTDYGSVVTSRWDTCVIIYNDFNNPTTASFHGYGTSFKSVGPTALGAGTSHGFYVGADFIDVILKDVTFDITGNSINRAWEIAAGIEEGDATGTFTLLNPNFISGVTVNAGSIVPTTNSSLVSLNASPRDGGNLTNVAAATVAAGVTNTFVKKSGDTMTGTLTLGSSTLNTSGAANFGTVAIDSSGNLQLGVGPTISFTEAAGNAVFNGSVTANSVNAALNASQLSSGTIPDARFPATLPAVNGSQLTGLSSGVSVAAGTNGIIAVTNGSIVTVSLANTVTVMYAQSLIATNASFQTGPTNTKATASTIAWYDASQVLTNLGGGGVPDSTLSANVPLKNAANIFSASQAINAANNLNVGGFIISTNGYQSVTNTIAANTALQPGLDYDIVTSGTVTIGLPIFGATGVPSSTYAYTSLRVTSSGTCTFTNHPSIHMSDGLSSRVLSNSMCVAIEIIPRARTNGAIVQFP